ncbi:MAG: 50S ribosomal protein L25/general stress protein Ctc [Bacteroidaceae bacterium]|nr:50S ribosomal protein L25/general stress protein Ctc [Bacteroidaceae bacterium]MCR4769602.1 50S ribosomal protein L25/general stress protein Ctc [Bacteroidaceae bacterium]
MKEISLNGQARTDLGKKASRELRREGMVPCVIYGVEKNENGAPKAQSFIVSQKELAKLLYTPNVYIVNLNLDGKEVKAILKDLQTDFVTDRPVHVDFYQITEEKPIVMEIPVKLNGLAAGVKAGGKLASSVRKLKVKSLYKNFPDTLDVDVTELGLGKSIKVSELSFENLDIVTPKEVVVCSVRMTRAARSAAEAAAQ